jgi:hypothetical protein
VSSGLAPAASDPIRTALLLVFSRAGFSHRLLHFRVAIMNTPRIPLALVMVPCLLAFIGCAGEKTPEADSSSGERKYNNFKPPALVDKAKELEAKQAMDKEAPIERKIVFNAEFELVVTDFVRAEKDLQALIQAHKGWAASADVSGTAGSSQTGTWKVRIPVSRFNEFREAVRKLGDIARYTSDSQDITEEYYDLANRIKSKEQELEALRKLFDKAAGKIEEVLAVQREVSRAQSELEQMKGRQRVLENLSELTTITIHMRERGTYEPTEPPSFGSSVEGTFVGSLNALIGFGKVLVLICVALGPWLIALALPLSIVGLALRRVWRRSRVRLASTEGPKPA